MTRISVGWTTDPLIVITVTQDDGTQKYFSLPPHEAISVAKGMLAAASQVESLSLVPQSIILPSGVTLPSTPTIGNVPGGVKLP